MVSILKLGPCVISSGPKRQEKEMPVSFLEIRNTGELRQRMNKVKMWNQKSKILDDQWRKIMKKILVAE